MLTLKQIDRAIAGILAAHFEDIEIQSNDVQEGFKRPSFFVVLDNIGTDTRQHYLVRTMTARIYYFPTDRYNYSIEVLEMQDKLNNLFNLNFVVEDRVITISETRSQIVDRVLEFEFDFEYHDFIKPDDDGKDLMQELVLDV